MGSGDLNMKKSWHPQRSGNVAATQKAEAEAIAERKKLQQRLQEIEEERRKEEIQKALEAAGGKRKIDRVEWMYSGPTDGQAGDAAENEAYLLGKRRIDKLLQDNETKKLQKNAGHDGPSSAGGMPALPPAANARDIATKIREDPLLAIKRQEQQAYEAVMNDPIKRRQLFASMGIDDPKSKSKTKDEKRHRHRHSDRSHRRRDGDRDRDGERSSRRRRRSLSGSRSRSPRRRDEGDDRKRRRRDSPDQRRRRSESVDSRDDDREREGRRERDRGRERRDSRGRRSYSRDRRSDSCGRRERRNGREHGRTERPKHDRPARESRSLSPPPRRRDELPEHDGPPPRRHGRDGDRTSYDRRGHRENGGRERAPPDNGADEKAREEERARKLAAMQAAATDLDLDRERRLAAIEEAERAQREADDRARQRNKRLGGDAGFVNQLHSRAAELKIADRVGRR